MFCIEILNGKVDTVVPKLVGCPRLVCGQEKVAAAIQVIPHIRACLGTHSGSYYHSVEIAV